MLQHVPRYPAKTTTRNLKEYLEENGFEVTQRTIQRDLKALSQVIAGLQVDGDKDIPGWSWAGDTMLKEIPSMDANMALTLKMANSFLGTMFPPSVLKTLDPYFECADNVLKQVDTSGYKKWNEKVRIFSRTQPLIPANISEETTAVVYEALFSGKQIRVRYKRRDGDEAEYDIHPLGLVFRESIIYLVATFWNYSDPRQLALHRFKACTLLEKDSVAPHDFDLDSYVSSGSFEYGSSDNELILLKVQFSNGAGLHLIEKPLSNDQIVDDQGDGDMIVRATVKDTWQLRWWLLGFGQYATIHEPGSLRAFFKEVAYKTLSNYD